MILAKFKKKKNPQNRKSGPFAPVKPLFSSFFLFRHLISKYISMRFKNTKFGEQRSGVASIAAILLRYNGSFQEFKYL